VAVLQRERRLFVGEEEDGVDVIGMLEAYKRAFSEETASLIPSMRVWLTNEYEHNGLRADGGRILDRLISLARS